MLTSVSPVRRVRVGHVPGDEPYVRRIACHPAVSPVQLSPPADGRVDAAWLAACESDIDVLHLHLGLGARLDTGGMLDVIRDRRLPLVVTVHAVNGVAGCDPVLLDVASSVLVLSPAVAADVRATWGRDPLLTVHPHVADPRRLHSGRSEPRAPGPWRLGLHLPSFGPDIAAAAVLRAAHRVLAAPGDDVVLDVRHHGDRPPGAVGDLLGDLEDHPRATVAVVDRRAADDWSVADWVAGLDLLLLASLRGSEAGWLQLCRDLGTGAVAGALPNHVLEGALATYPVGACATSPAVVARAVERALARLPVVPVPAATRFAEAARVREEHAAVYRAAVAARPRDLEHGDGTSHW